MPSVRAMLQMAFCDLSVDLTVSPKEMINKVSERYFIRLNQLLVSLSVCLPTPKRLMTKILRGTGAGRKHILSLPH